MSRPDDRVAVPTNGHHPALPPEADAAGSITSDHPTPAVTDRPPSTVRPAQLAAGFGIIAALIVLALGRRRGRGH